MTQDKINAYFENCEKDLVDKITRLVAVKSVKEEAQPGKPFGQGPADALALALQMAGEMGFATKNYDNYVGTADLNDKKTRMDILCHLDVVGEGIGWSTPPYTAVLKDGLLYGRGTSDNKGPAVAALIAMKAVKDMGIPLRYNVRLILGTDEESGSSDIAYYFKKEKSPEYTFSPDGTFPVTNIEKGGFQPTFSKNWVVSEALPRIVSAKGGYRINVIPPQAEALVEGLPVEEIRRLSIPAARVTGAEFAVSEENNAVKIFVTGKAEHASTPQEGCNAVTALITLLASLPLAESESFSAIKALNKLFPHGDYYGKAAGIAHSDDISGSLTLSFDIFELNLTGFTGRFDSRAPICATKANTVDVMAEKFNKLGMHMEGSLRPTHHTPAGTEFIKTLLAVYEQYTGRKGSCEYTGGGTYVHDIEGGVCFGAMMPDFEPKMHGADERINVKDMITAAKIFTQVIINLCS